MSDTSELLNLFYRVGRFESATGGLVFEQVMRDPQDLRVWTESFIGHGFYDRLPQTDQTPVWYGRVRADYFGSGEYEVAIVSVLLCRHYSMRLSVFAIGKNCVKLRISDLIDYTPVKLYELVNSLVHRIFYKNWSVISGLGLSNLELGKGVADWRELSSDDVANLKDLMHKLPN